MPSHYWTFGRLPPASTTVSGNEESGWVQDPWRLLCSGGADACCHGPVSLPPSHLTLPWAIRARASNSTSYAHHSYCTPLRSYQPAYEPIQREPQARWDKGRGSRGAVVVLAFCGTLPYSAPNRHWQDWKTPCPMLALQVVWDYFGCACTQYRVRTVYCI